WPLSRRTEMTGGSDVAVYTAQLGEIEADRAGGRISESEAQAARTEVSRRLLAAADTQPSVAAADSPRRRHAVALVALTLLPLAGAALYLTIGSPDLPGQPFADRSATGVEQATIEENIARIEAFLTEHPDDARGWQVLAPVYMRLGRFDDAVR